MLVDWTVKMNNYERIKTMSIDEMAKVLSKPVCFHCIDNKNECCNENCKKGVKQWLEIEEVND